MMLDPMRMMLNKVEFEFSRRPWPVYKTTLRPALKLLCHIKVVLSQSKLFLENSFRPNKCFH